MLKSSDEYATLAENECKTGGHPGKGLVYAKLAEVAVLRAQLQVDADRESRESFRDRADRTDETARAIEKLADQVAKLTARPPTATSKFRGKQA